MAATLAVASVDRFVKNFITTYPARSGVIAAGWLNFRVAANAGLAFSLPFPRGMVPGLSSGVILAFSWWWLLAYRRRDGLQISALTAILGGASSNLLDRLRWGHVVDYLDVPWFSVFNLADVLISVGVGLLIMQELIRWLQGRRKTAV